MSQKIVVFICALIIAVLSQNVVTFGKNWYGELGAGNRVNTQIGVGHSPLGVKTENFTTPLPPWNITVMAVLVDAGNDHTVVYGDDGYLYAFGSNQFGQLGNGLSGSGVRSPFPVRVNFTPSTDETVVSVGTSWSDYSVVLLKNRKTGLTSLWSWGHHTNGYLGYGDLGQFGRNQSTPRAVKMNNLQTEVIKTLQVADTHSLILTETGKVYSWGDNTHGQLGDSSTQAKSEPTAVLLTPLGGKLVLSISAHGGFHSFIITTDGLLFAWGRNHLGQLGDGTQVNRLSPVPVLGILTNKQITSVVGGLDHSIVYTSESKVYGMGGNAFGQAGNKSIDSPIAMGAVEATAMNELFYKIGMWPLKIYAGSETTYFLFQNGAIYTFGNNWGQLGDGTQKTNILGAKVRTDDNGDFFKREIVDLAVGEQHVVVIASNAYTMMMSFMCMIVAVLFL